MDVCVLLASNLIRPTIECNIATREVDSLWDRTRPTLKKVAMLIAVELCKAMGQAVQFYKGAIESMKKLSILKFELSAKSYKKYNQIIHRLYHA